MNSKVKTILGALIIVLIGLLLTPIVVSQVNSTTQLQTCPSDAETPVATDITITSNIITELPAGTYGKGELCAANAAGAALLEPTAVAAATATAVVAQKASTPPGALAYDTTGAKNIMELITIFWVLGLLGGAIGFIYLQFRHG